MFSAYKLISGILRRIRSLTCRRLHDHGSSASEDDVFNRIFIAERLSCAKVNVQTLTGVKPLEICK